MKASTSLHLYFILAMLVWVVLLIVFIRYYPRKARTESFQSKEVPKRIWSYWDNPDTIPKTVEVCKKTWMQYNPGYTIEILNKANYKEFVDIPDEIANHPRFNDMPQRFADLLRCYLLVEYGGVWCDSSILMGDSLDTLIQQNPGKDLYAFTIEFGNHPERPPVIENWFIAAPLGSPFMKQWHAEFLNLQKFPTAKDYVDDLVARGVDNRDFCCPDYLAMHHSAQKILQLDGYPVDKLQLWPCKEGPFRYIYENDWNPEKAIEAACKNPALRKPFLKMRQNERAVFENGMDQQFSNEKCKWYE